MGSWSTPKWWCNVLIVINSYETLANVRFHNGVIAAENSGFELVQSIPECFRAIYVAPKTRTEIWRYVQSENAFHRIRTTFLGGETLQLRVGKIASTAGLYYFFENLWGSMVDASTFCYHLQQITSDLWAHRFSAKLIERNDTLRKAIFMITSGTAIIRLDSNGWNTWSMDCPPVGNLVEMDYKAAPGTSTYVIYFKDL